MVPVRFVFVLVAVGLAPFDAAASEPRATEQGAPTESCSEPDRPRNIYGYEIVSANLSLDIAGRFFSYNDGLSTNLRPYELFGAPGLSTRAEVFPFATSGAVFVRDLGFYGEFRIQPGVESETTTGTRLGTEWLRFGGGLRYRIPIDIDREDKAPLVLGMRGGLHQDRFVIESAPEVAGETPSVKYTFLRFGLDGRFPIGPVALTAFGGYLGATASGEVHERFRDASIGGIDVGGGLVVPILHGFEARISVEYIRWFYAFGPIPGDEYVAGGALDEQAHLEAGLQYVY